MPAAGFGTPSFNRLQGLFLSEPLFRGPHLPKREVDPITGWRAGRTPDAERLRKLSRQAKLVFHTKAPASWSHSCLCRKGALAAWQKGFGSAGNSTRQREGRWEDFARSPPLRRAAGWRSFYSFQSLLDAISRARLLAPPPIRRLVTSAFPAFL